MARHDKRYYDGKKELSEKILRWRKDWSFIYCSEDHFMFPRQQLPKHLPTKTVLKKYPVSGSCALWGWGASGRDWLFVCLSLSLFNFLAREGWGEEGEEFEITPHHTTICLAPRILCPLTCPNIDSPIPHHTLPPNCYSKHTEIQAWRSFGRNRRRHMTALKMQAKMPTYPRKWSTLLLSSSLRDLGHYLEEYRTIWSRQTTLQ